MKVSFVIPCYNTSSIICKIIEEVEKLAAKKVFDEYEVILINDASPDVGVLERLKKVAKEKRYIKLIDLAKNSGQPNAILTGCRYADGDYIMTSDDDGQTSLELLEQFFKKMEEGYDVVCAKYTARPQKSLLRRLGSAANRKMADLLIPRPDGVYMSTVFLAKKFVINEIIKYKQPYAYISGLLLRVTQNIGNVEMEQRARSQGESGYTVKKLLALWLNGFTAFSIMPLRIADFIGCLFAIGGFSLAFFTVIRKIFYTGIYVGWSSLMAVMLIVSGITLLLLGITGEYIGRIYMCINGTPQSVVREIFYSDNMKIDKEQKN